MSQAAARLSAERPVRNAATRSGEAFSVFAMRAPAFLGERQRTGIDLAARPAGNLDRMRHRVLDAVLLERGSKDIVEFVLRHPLGAGRRRADHKDELAARFEAA